MTFWEPRYTWLEGWAIGCLLAGIIVMILGIPFLTYGLIWGFLVGACLITIGAVLSMIRLS